MSPVDAALRQKRKLKAKPNKTHSKSHNFQKRIVSQMDSTDTIDDLDFEVSEDEEVSFT